MKTVRIFSLAVLLTAGPAVMTRQQQQQMEQQVKAGPAPAASKAPSKAVKEDRQLAMQLLEVSESTSRGFEPPMRTYGLFQLGEIFTSSDKPKATELLKDAFTASLSIADDNDTKEALQNEIFRDLLPLSQAEVEERLAQAEPAVRKRASEAIVRSYIEKKQYGPAMDLVTQVTGWDEFPYGSGTALLLAMPAEMQAEKMSLLTQAVASYKAHEHPGIVMGGGTFTDLLVRFGPRMPSKLALEAIDEVLSQAKKSDQKAAISLSSGGGTAAFNSLYEYELFAMLPVLRVFDEGRAETLLKENQTLTSTMDKFPNGMQSIDPTMTDAPLKEGQKGGYGSSVTTGNSASNNQNYLRQEMQRKAAQIVSDSPANPIQAIAAALALPLTVAEQRNSPRAMALEGIARRNFKDNPMPARQAIDELRKAIVDLPLQTQAQFLGAAADLYLQMGEKESAAKVVEEGFKLSDKLFDLDINPDEPNKALKAWWPSTDSYRRFIEVQGRLSHRGATEILKEIKDPEVRTVESIMLSRSLLNLPMNRVRIQTKTKHGNSTSVSDNK